MSFTPSSTFIELPRSLSPDLLYATACQSPDALVSYIAGTLDQHEALESLANSLQARVPSAADERTRMWRTPGAADNTSSNSVVSDFKSLLVCSDPCRLGVVYPLAGARNSEKHTAWSVSFIDAFFCLDTLLTENNPLGWLCVALLPIVRIHSPLAYECAIQSVYGVLYESENLLAEAYDHNKRNISFSAGTMHPLMVLSKSIKWEYPGIDTYLDTLAPANLRLLLRNNPKQLFEHPESFRRMVKASLIMQVPSLRLTPRLPAERELLLLKFGINVNIANGSLDVPKGTNLTYLDTSDPNHIDTTWSIPATRANRELVVHSFVRKAARISLLRNTEFILHLYNVLDSVFSFYSVDSYKAREHLAACLKGFSCYSSLKNNGADPTTPELLEAISPSENFIHIGYDTDRHLNRLVFTISLNKFLSDYCGNDLGFFSRLQNKGTFSTSFEESIPTFSAIRECVLKGERLLDSPLSTKDNDILPAVMLSKLSTRTSRTYFMAYTASLAKAMNAVFSLVKARMGFSFNPTDKSKYTLFPLIQDVGVLLGDSAGNPLNIHVPRYINFLMTMGYLGPLAPYLAELHKADPKCTPRYLLFPSDREQYLDTMTRLANPSLRDLLDGPKITFYDSSDVGTSYLSKVEWGNSYFDTRNDPSRFSLFLSLSMQSVTNTLVMAYRRRKDIPVCAQKNRIKSETKSSSDKRRRGPRDPLKIPCTLRSTKDNNNDEIRVLISLVRANGVTYFGLPWMFLRDNLKLPAYPPNPKYVYHNIPGGVDKTTYKRLSCNITGMYADTYTHAREGYCYDFHCMGSEDVDLSLERTYLRSWVKVLKATPYLFSLRGLLALPPDAWDGGVNPLKECSELHYLLLKLENAPYSELRTSSIVYENRLDAAKHKKELDEAKREGRINEGVDPAFKVSPSDSRLSFTAEEDAAILALYHVGMKPTTRVELLCKCAGHTWISIVGRAKLLCEVLISEGVTDPTKLPYIRATLRIKKLLEKMNA